MLLKSPLLLAYIDPGSGFTVSGLAGLIGVMLSGILALFVGYLKKFNNLLKHHPKFWIFLIILVIFIYLGSRLQMNNKNTQLQKRIIVIGIDAMSPHITESLMAQGQLPNFTRLQSEGGYRQLATTTPPESPVAWSSFSTGQNPGKHGIFDFITRDPKEIQLTLSLSNTEDGIAKTVIRSPRFWQYLTQKRIPSVILRCPISFPPDRIQGKMLSGMGVPDILGTQGTFSFYTSAKEIKSDSAGGKIYHVTPSTQIVDYFWGPKFAKTLGGTEVSKVPFKITLSPKGEAILRFQDKEIQLINGQWSSWQEITFDLGFLRKSKAIFKLLLLETNPEFKLYVSPFNLNPQDPFFPISDPPGYAKKLSEEIGLFHTQGMPFDTWALNDEYIDEEHFLAQANEIFEEQEKLLFHELAHFDNGVFYFYFDEIDIIQHMFWRYIDPQSPLPKSAQSPKYAATINDWYKKMDLLLGKILDQLQPQDIVIVLSDHGFDAYRKTVHINSWLRENGYLELKDPGAISGEPLLKSIDWAKTRAYALGFSSIYLNEKGREPHGIIYPGLDAQNLKKELSGKLTQWVDPSTKIPVIHKVYLQEDLYSGSQTTKAPDLILGFNLGYGASWQTALGASPKDLIEDNLQKWSGTHLFDSSLMNGVIFTNRPIHKQYPSIMDIAPTLLQLTGFTAEEIKKANFDGSFLF